MNQGRWLTSKFFSQHGITDTMFPSRATFQDQNVVPDDNFEIRVDQAGSWTTVPGYEDIPCMYAPEVTGRPASSTEYKNQADVPHSIAEVDYRYVMLKGYWPGLKKRWRLLIDGTEVTMSPSTQNNDADVWGIESDSQRTFTRLRVYVQRF